MQKFNFYSEQVKKQQHCPLLSQNHQQLQQHPNKALVIQSEPRLKTNQEDWNSYYNKMCQVARRQAEKENKLILRTKNDSLCEFPIFSDAKKLIWENHYYDNDVETTCSYMDEGINLCVNDLNKAIQEQENSEHSIVDSCLENEPSQGLKNDDYLE